MTINFFISYHHGAGFGRLQHTAAEARDIVRHAASTGIKAKTLPVRDLTGDDFADYHQRLILRDLGYFSSDLADHRAKRDEQEARRYEIAAAYIALGLNQKREYDRIAGSIPNSEGTWPRSTARYARDVESLDNCVLAHAEDGARQHHPGLDGIAGFPAEPHADWIRSFAPGSPTRANYFTKGG
jgi:hypothetical protein